MINVEQNVPLGPMTTMKVGGPAKYFVRVSAPEEITDAIEFAHEKRLPTFILGGGANIIFSDKGFDGLVIKCESHDIDTNEDGTITVSAGVPLGKVVAAAGAKGFSGIEWAAGIPGTVGGAVRGNAGAFGGETKDIVNEVSFLDVDSKKVETIGNVDCKFGYRDSIFKHNGNVIVSVKIKLTPGQDSEKLQAKAQEYVQYRTQRHPLEYPSAGSIFKNVPVDNVPQKYLDEFKDAIKNDPFPIVPVAKIIAEAGLAGEKIGGAQVSEKHTNYIINTGNATSADIIALIKKVKDAVRQKYQIELEAEPQIVE